VSAAPRVTIGLPLYRSARYLAGIFANLERLDEPDVEILVSDRHQEDDALERIAARFPGDRRFHFLAARDRVGWVDNYNSLLRAATGDAFMWWSHDDVYPSGFVGALQACLEREPEVLCAYGRVDLIDDDGRPSSYQPPAELLLAPGEAWTPRAALRQMLFRPSFSPPSKGLFRRAAVVDAGLFIRAPRGTVWADVYWTYALGLLGAPRLVPGAGFGKRVHARSASARWEGLGLGVVASGHAVLLSYIRDFAPDLATRAEATAAVTAWSLARAAAAAPARLPLPGRGRALARRVLARALGSPGYC
jgi:GT2 family glycosyltransferase